MVGGCKKKKKTNERNHAVTREYCGSPSDDEHVTGVCYMCNCLMYLISVNRKQLEICLLERIWAHPPTFRTLWQRSISRSSGCSHFTMTLGLLLLQSALQPLVGFGLLYDFVPQSSIFTLLSLQFLTFIFFRSSSTWSSHLSLDLPTGLDEHGSHSVTFLTIIVVSILTTCAAHRNLCYFINLTIFFFS